MTTKTLNLSGQWSLSSTSPAFGKRTIPVELPGDNYSALLDAGLMPDPYYGANENIVQDFRRYTWVFKREFEVSDELLASSHIYLEASMVDLFCTIRINGKIAVECGNQFAVYRPDVKPFLKKGKNRISLTIRPVESEAEAIAKTLPKEYPMNTVCSVKGMNLVRKPHCAGGWDWGVTLMTSGVYAPLVLKGVNKSRIDYVYTNQHHENGVAHVTAVAVLYAPKPCEQKVSFAFNGMTKAQKVQLAVGENTVEMDFTVTNPRLWWPNGYGEQNLYPLTVSTEDDEMTREIGLRSLEVVNQRDQWGLSMTFRINGVDIFAKGADWIPCDAFPGRQTVERYENLLESARLANMNMLRVWGGGQYEKDIFYELCDRKGILIWQDMMFSCSLYPSSEEFIATVQDELQYQLRRLRSHASLALWCGDNEVLGATGWFGGNRTAWIVNYDRLNRELERMARKHDPSRVFWPSSPCGGPGNFSDGWHNDSEGDMHYWEVWHGGKNFSAYYGIKPRFCSEFGFQSFPSLETVASYCPESEMNVFSPIMEHHQKCPTGNTPIISMFSRYFRMPESNPAFFYLSQVQQALAIKTGVEFWRTLRPRCMGTIFWQLNDDWPVASWSSIEYGGNWKQLQYHARRFYMPVISTIINPPSEPEAALYTINDHDHPVNAKVTLRGMDFDGKCLSKETFTLKLKAGESCRVKAFPKEELEKLKAEGVFFVMETVVGGLHGSRHLNEFFLAEYKALPLQKANVTMTVKKVKNAYEVEVSTDKPVLYLTLSATGIPGLFSDNSITLLPKENRTLTFTPQGPCTVAKLKAALRLEHLRMTYL